jgi:hypothetical protein
MNEPRKQHPYILRNREAALEEDLRVIDDAIEDACPDGPRYPRLLRERRIAAKLLNTVRVSLQLSQNPVHRHRLA